MSALVTILVLLLLLLVNIVIVTECYLRMKYNSERGGRQAGRHRKEERKDDGK